jgi:hypothetical protein
MIKHPRTKAQLYLQTVGIALLTPFAFLALVTEVIDVMALLGYENFPEFVAVMFVGCIQMLFYLAMGWVEDAEFTTGMVPVFMVGLTLLEVLLWGQPPNWREVYPGENENLRQATTLLEVGLISAWLLISTSIAAKNYYNANREYIDETDGSQSN